MKQVTEAFGFVLTSTFLKYKDQKHFQLFPPLLRALGEPISNVIVICGNEFCT